MAPTDRRVAAIALDLTESATSSSSSSSSTARASSSLPTSPRHRKHDTDALIRKRYPDDDRVFHVNKRVLSELVQSYYATPEALRSVWMRSDPMAWAIYEAHMAKVT